MTDYSKPKYQTNFLASKSSITTGIGSCFNIWGNYYKFNTSKTPQEANRKAFNSSWGVIGQSFGNLLKKLKSE